MLDAQTKAADVRVLPSAEMAMSRYFSCVMKRRGAPRPENPAARRALALARPSLGRARVCPVPCVRRLRPCSRRQAECAWRFGTSGPRLARSGWSFVVRRRRFGLGGRRFVVRDRRFDVDAARFAVDARRCAVDAGRFAVDAGRCGVDAGRFAVDARRCAADARRRDACSNRTALEPRRQVLDAARKVGDATPSIKVSLFIRTSQTADVRGA